MPATVVAIRVYSRLHGEALYSLLHLSRDVLWPYFLLVPSLVKSPPQSRKNKRIPKSGPYICLAIAIKVLLSWHSPCPSFPSILRSRHSVCCWESQGGCCLFLKWEALLGAQDTENGCLRSSNHAIYKATAAARLCLNDMSAKAMKQTAFRNNAKRKKPQKRQHRQKGVKTGSF